MTSDHNKLLKLQRAVASLAPELKWFTSSGSVLNVNDGNGSIACVSLVAQGTDDVNRIGNQISAKKISINCKLIDGGSAVGSVSTYTVYLVRDDDSNGIIPTVSGAANSILDGSQPINQLQRSVENRFKILRKKVLTGAMLAAGSAHYLWNWTVPLNFKMTFRGSAGTQINVGRYGLYLVFVSDDAADTVDFAYTQHLCFTDA